ncbi:hypothetical protein V3C99_015973 [Haemonchus contortus]
MDHHDRFFKGVTTPADTCPTLTFSTELRTVLAIETISICLLSGIAQIPMILATKKFAGWNSDFSFTILMLMSVVALQLYIGEFIAHIRFAMDLKSSFIDQILGATFLTSFFTYVILDGTLILHRVAYTFYPYSAGRVLSKTVLEIYLGFVGALHISIIALMISPLCGYQFCPQTMKRFFTNGPLSPFLVWMNRVCNHVFGLTGLFAYVAICVYLFARGTLRFGNNSEIRLTLQVIVMSTIGMFYFSYFEFHEMLKIPQPTATIIYETVVLLYYNAEFAPYLLLNKTFRHEYFSCRSRHRRIATVFTVRSAKLKLSNVQEKSMLWRKRH